MWTSWNNRSSLYIYIYIYIYTVHARSTRCTFSTFEEHWMQCWYCVAQATQHTVCPQGQKVAPTGLSLQTRHVMRFLILHSSSSSCCALLSTAEASRQEELGRKGARRGSLSLYSGGGPVGRPGEWNPRQLWLDERGLQIARCS